MFQITIIHRDTSVQIVLWFESSTSMTEQLTKIEETWQAKLTAPTAPSFRNLMTLRDDYGHIQKILPENILAIISTDLKKEGDGHIENQLIKHRAQKKLEMRVQNDPVVNIAGNSPFRN